MEKHRQKDKEPEFITDPRLIHRLTVNEDEVQFPYNNLKEYLLRRGRKDLAAMVEWDYDTPDARSKTFINSYKIYLQFNYPERCGTINKNEAHVRLTSSMWYASIALIRLAWIGTALIVLTFPLALHISHLKPDVGQLTIYPFLMNICLFYFANRTKKNSEKFLHYQRVREIFYVLETMLISNEAKHNTGYRIKADASKT